MRPRSFPEGPDVRSRGCVSAPPALRQANDAVAVAFAQAAERRQAIKRLVLEDEPTPRSSRSDKR
jgi:hypothetical protein